MLFFESLLAHLAGDYLIHPGGFATRVPDSAHPRVRDHGFKCRQTVVSFADKIKPVQLRQTYNTGRETGLRYRHPHSRR